MTPYDRKRLRFFKRGLVALTLFVVSSTVVTLAAWLLQDSLPEWADGNPLVGVALACFTVVLAVTPIDHAYNWLFRQVLFPRRSHTHLLLRNLVRDLAATEDFPELANLLVNTLGEVLGFPTVSLLVRSSVEEGYGVVSAYGWNVSDYRKLRIQEGNALIELVKAARPQALLQEQVVRSLSWQEANQITPHFETLHASCVIPLWAKTELVGTINLLAPGMFDDQDEGHLRLFQDFAEEVAWIVRKTLAIENLRRLNEKLQDAHSELVRGAKLQAIEQLATGIAHEIHNPLTIISGKAQVLLLQKDRKPYDEKVEEVLRTVVKQTQRAADITRKLLMFSRGSASAREKLRLETVLEDTLSLIAYQTSLEGTEIRRLVGHDLPEFYGNVQELREIFLNLILNALQAIQPGGQVQVGITFQKADELFEIQVTDNGAGIPREHLSQVFNPFFTTRPGRAGLGLFVTQQIVHRYDGSIRVESEPGEGTLVVVELPLQEVRSETSNISASPGSGAEGNFLREVLR